MEKRNVIKSSLAIALSFSFFLAIPTLSEAAPSISGVSGTLKNGSSVSISGSGFGTHPDYHTNVSGKLPWLWQDFESNIQYDGLTANYPANWTRTTSGGRSGYWAQRSGSGNIQGLQTGNIPLSTGTIYLSSWMYIPSNVADGKTVRFRFNNQSVDYWYNLKSGNLASDAPSQFVTWGALSSAPKDTWFRLDMLLTNNSQKFYILGVNSNNPIYNDTKSSIVSNNTAELNLGAGYDSSTGYWGFDDVFGNFTQARVELCNTSTWAARTKCEIQIPSAWSAGNITMKFNQGSFPNATAGYLYVVDSAGGVNANGLQISIGGGATPSIPAPSLIKVNLQ